MQRHFCKKYRVLVIVLLPNGRQHMAHMWVEHVNGGGSRTTIELVIECAFGTIYSGAFV